MHGKLSWEGIKTGELRRYLKIKQNLKQRTQHNLLLGTEKMTKRAVGNKDPIEDKFISLNLLISHWKLWMAKKNPGSSKQSRQGPTLRMGKASILVHKRDQPFKPCKTWKRWGATHSLPKAQNPSLLPVHSTPLISMYAAGDGERDPCSENTILLGQTWLWWGLKVSEWVADTFSKASFLLLRLSFPLV